MEAAFGDQAVEVGMEDHGLTPGVEGGNDAGLCADMFWIREELEEGIPYALEEEAGHLPDVEEPEIIELMGDGEDDVVMAAGEKSLLLPFQPLRDLCPFALRAEAMAAGVVPMPLIVAFRTCFHVTAEFGGSAHHQRTRRLADVERKRMGLLVGQIRKCDDMLDTGPPHSDIVSSCPLCSQSVSIVFNLVQRRIEPDAAVWRIGSNDGLGGLLCFFNFLKFVFLL
jgi:hypothetical protein